MTYEIILADLSNRFGDQIMLTVKQIAVILRKSPDSIYKSIKRKSLTIPFQKQGARHLVSIYHLAHWINGDYVLSKTEKDKVEFKPKKKKVVDNSTEHYGTPISDRLFFR